VEIVPELAEQARRNLERAGVGNVAVETGDGAEGWSHRGPTPPQIQTFLKKKNLQNESKRTKYGLNVVYS
jgi:tRNA/tmRNA/rRNA uracil-C5-methylase (TrmA/RlmC/RlmD family)